MRMRGSDDREQALFSYVSLEERVPRDHPLRTVKKLVDGILRDLSPRFDAMYARVGRPSIPPEQLMRALLLQIFYSVRSERLLMEQLDYNLLFRWFVGLGMDDAVWVPTTFTKNRDRLLSGEVARAFFVAVREEARRRKLLSDEHFTVDGTLLEAWASHKSFRPKDEPPEPGSGGRNPEVDFHGEKRSNATHQSTTDPDARLARKGNPAAKLCYSANVRHGRAGQRAGDAGAAAPPQAATHPGSRQGLRHEGVRGWGPGTGLHSARGAEHQGTPQCDRRADDTARRIRGEPAEAQAGGAGLRLGQDRGAAAEAASSRQ
jgi:transposase